MECTVGVLGPWSACIGYCIGLELVTLACTAALWRCIAATLTHISTAVTVFVRLQIVSETFTEEHHTIFEASIEVERHIATVFLMEHKVDQRISVDFKV